jgi:hypothetical protein
LICIAGLPEFSGLRAFFQPAHPSVPLAPLRKHSGDPIRHMNAPPVIPAKCKEPGWTCAYRLIGAFSLVWILTVHCMVIVLTFPFYEVPKGTLIRPMGYGFNIIMWSLAGIVMAPVATVALYFRRRSLWAWLVLVLAFTPLPLARAIFYDAQARQGFVLAE